MSTLCKCQELREERDQARREHDDLKADLLHEKTRGHGRQCISFADKEAADEGERKLAGYDDLKAELDAVMWFVDKWFDDDPEKHGDPANRANGAREIALQAIESETARADKAEARVAELELAALGLVATADAGGE